MTQAPDNTSPQTGRHVRAFLWLLAQVVRTSPRVCALWLAGSLVSGALIPAQLWLTRTLVNALAAPLQGQPDPRILLWLALLAAAVMAERIISGAEGWLSAELREDAGATVREAVMNRASRLPAAAFEDQAYYDRLSRVMGDAEQRVPAAMGQSLSLARRVPHLLGYSAGLFAVSPELLAVTLVAWAPAIAVFFRAGQSHFGLLRKRTPAIRLADWYDGELRWRMTAKEVRLYQLRDYLLGRWESLYWQTRNEQRALAFRMGLRQQGTVLLSECVSVSGLLGVAAAGWVRGTPGDYALLFQSLLGLVQSLFGTANTMQTLGEHVEYARDYREFMTLPVEELVLRRHQDDAPSAPAAPVASMASEGRRDAPLLRPFPRPLSEGIRFVDVWFTYPGTDHPALCGVSFSIRPGEKLALVGENGAGKSTLVKLMLGLFQPDSGRVTFDGIDAAEIDLSAQRQAMSAVFQSFTKYQLTLAENVGLGQPALAGDRERVRTAAQRAGVDEFAGSLSRGYDTMLNPEAGRRLIQDQAISPEAGGTDLSGGQWQRVAAARAFFREADVLVLDEPTAALDPLAELAVFERFVELAEGKTAVLISHRLGMARLADRVVVLREGRVVEDGPHAELMRAGGEYAALFGAQARWYA